MVKTHVIQTNWLLPFESKLYPMNLKKTILSLCCLLFVLNTSAQVWELVWSDEFDGTSLNTDNWTAVVAGTGFGNQEKQYYTNRPENLRVEDGKLIITALLEDYSVGQSSWKYTSARITSSNKRDFTYGKIEARLKLPTGLGTWPAFWTLGYGSWPTAGEIDIMEYVGRKPDEIQCNVHTKDYNGMNGKNKGMTKSVPNAADEFHTYAIEWDKDKIKFFFDGEHYWSFSALTVNEINYPFTKAQYIILNLAIGGTMGGAIDDSIFPQEYIVDYVRVYKEVGSGLENKSMTQKPIVQSLFSDELSVIFQEETALKRTVSVIDLTGKRVITKNGNGTGINIPTNSLIQGMYFVRIQEGDKTYVQKVIKK